MSTLVQRVRDRLAADEADGAHGGVGRVGVDGALAAAAPGLIDDATLAVLRRDVTAELTGAGPLEELLALRGVTDVLVNAPDQVWFDRGRGMERAEIRFADEVAVRRLAQRLATVAGRRLDDASPFVDARLPDGTRLHAILPPLVACTTVSLRVLGRRRYRLDELTALALMSPQLADVLRAVVAARLSVLISGGTGTGNTTWNL